MKASTTADGSVCLATDLGCSWFNVVPRAGGGSYSFGIYAGRVSADMYDGAIGLSEQAIRTSSPVLFVCDAIHATSYDSAFRERWVSFFVRHRAQISALHFSVQGGLLRMGLQLVNLALPSFAKTYDTDGDLDAFLGADADAFAALRRERDAYVAEHPRRR